MRLRQDSTNCSVSITWDVFEEKFLLVDFLKFNDDLETFRMYNPSGEFIEEFDLFFEDKDERLAFKARLREFDGIHGYPLTE